MTFFRVVGALRAYYLSAGDAANIDLDLTILAYSAGDARVRAQIIAAEGYDYARWVDDPVVEEEQEAACSQNEN